MRIILSWVGLVCCSFWVSGLIAQTTTMQVVTKKIDKSFPYKEGYELNIEGEKAEVSIETWAENSINIQLELVAKHPDKALAEAALEQMVYDAKREKNKIYVRNYIKDKDGQAEPVAKLNARYVIKVPEQCQVYLKNYFGIASIRNLSNGLRLNSEFTRVGLDNIKGDIDVRTRFGNLLAQQLDGNMNLYSRHSEITLREIKGRYDIQSQYDILRIFADENLLDLAITAEKSQVYLYHPQPQLFAYNLTAVSSDLQLPQEMKFDFTNEPLIERKVATYKPQQEVFANIKITISFGDLAIDRRN